jgi:RNA polymerase sigma-70 factor (ECF subfamily)
MASAAGGPDRDFESYRAYLHLLARLQVPRHLHGKLDLSGIVQTTLFEAHRSQEDLRAQDPGPWLRRILVHNLTDELRKWGAGKRAGDREQSLEKALSDSSSRLEALLAADQSSPVQKAIRNEQVVHLAQALASLPEGQRRAVELHYLKACPVAVVAAELGCSKAAVAGLLHRGLANLRARLENASGE